MSSFKLKIFVVFILAIGFVSYSNLALAEGVEIEFDGLSPAAQQALKNMSLERQKIKSELESPMERLKTLKNTYKGSCGTGKPNDSGCQDQFNQIIDAHKAVMESIAGFLTDYNDNLKVVIEELEPQLENIAYNNTPSDIVEDMVRKHEEVEEEFEDPFALGITKAFGLGEGETEYEMASSSYMQYKSEFQQYKRLAKMLQRRILTAQRQRDLGQILNEDTQNELKSITTWIYGNNIRRETKSAQRSKRTNVLR